MSYLITHFWPEGTEEQYRATLAAGSAAAGGPPPEQVHAAGPTEGGFLVAAVYESKAACDDFIQKLMSVMPVEGGLVGPPQGHGAEIVNSAGISA